MSPQRRGNQLLATVQNRWAAEDQGAAHPPRVGKRARAAALSGPATRRGLLTALRDCLRAIRLRRPVSAALQRTVDELS